MKIINKDQSYVKIAHMDQFQSLAMLFNKKNIMPATLYSLSYNTTNNEIKFNLTRCYVKPPQILTKRCQLLLFESFINDLLIKRLRIQKILR